MVSTGNEESMKGVAETNVSHSGCSRPARRGRPPKLKIPAASEPRSVLESATCAPMQCSVPVRIGRPPKRKNVIGPTLISSEGNAKKSKGVEKAIPYVTQSNCCCTLMQNTFSESECVPTKGFPTQLHETTLVSNVENVKKRKGVTQSIANRSQAECNGPVKQSRLPKQTSVVEAEPVPRLENATNSQLQSIASGSTSSRCRENDLVASTLSPVVHIKTTKRGRPSKVKAHSTGLIDFGPPKYVCEFCSAFHWLEERLTKYKASDPPKFSMCCKEGRMQLPRCREPPELLKSLLAYDGGPKARRFRATIRPNNCRFAFSSMGAKIDNSLNLGSGPPIFRVSGQNCHRMGSLLPVEGSSPQFAQLYIYDTDNEVANRLNAVPLSSTPDPLDIEIVTDLKNMFDEHNELVKIFRTARDIYENNGVQDFKLKLLPGGGRANPQYSDPEVAETVALIIGSEDEIATGFDIVIQSRSGHMQRIDGTYPSYMALQYPIIYPHGENGYHNKMYEMQAPGAKKRPQKISMCDYYRYQLQFRKDEWSTLMMAGRLKQQFEVDAYCSVEAERLNFHRFNQKDVRVEFLNGLVDAANRGEMDGDSLGRKIVLPSSFTGGPRYMGQMYQLIHSKCN